MSEDKKHTPLPWGVTGVYGSSTIGHIDGLGSGGGQIATTWNEQGGLVNAEFIVRACNSYYEHPLNYKLIKDRLIYFCNTNGISKVQYSKVMNLIFTVIDPAIAKAEGK